MSRLVLIIFLMLAVSGCSSTFRAMKTVMPSLSGFVEVSDGIYVDKAMPQSQRDEIIRTVGVARLRVAQFFGELQGRPNIFACSTEACFGPNSHGATPKGQAYGSSALMLSPRGLTDVIVSHELTHIELHTRIGTLRSARAVPDWFDEGLAVLVSQDPRYSETAWRLATEGGRKAPKLKALTWGKGDWVLNYGTARYAVGSWYVEAGYDGLMRLIDAVKNGTDFERALNEAAIPKEPSFGVPTSVNTGQVH